LVQEMGIHYSQGYFFGPPQNQSLANQASLTPHAHA